MPCELDSGHGEAGCSEHGGGRRGNGARSRHRRRPARSGQVVLAVLLAVVGFVLGGCGADREPAGMPVVLAELCAAEAADPATAAQRFEQAHGQLHTLAEQTQTHDRQAAGELLEAKRAVEDALAKPRAARDELAGELERLVAAVRGALAATDRPAPPCDAREATT